MTRAWIGLISLCMADSQEVMSYTVAEGKAGLPDPGTSVWLVIIGGLLGVCCICCCFKLACDRCNEHVNQMQNQMTSTTTAEERDVSDKERHLPSQRVNVHPVDEKLIDTGLPQAELILTTFGKLLSDLTAYSGAPDVQGLLVLDFESGDFIQIFDMGRIPRGRAKVQVVIAGDKTFLRLYPDIQ